MTQMCTPAHAESSGPPGISVQLDYHAVISNPVSIEKSCIVYADVATWTVESLPPCQAICSSNIYATSEPVSTAYVNRQCTSVNRLNLTTKILKQSWNSPGWYFTAVSRGGLSTKSLAV